MADHAAKIAFEALTYDDVLLLPGYSEVLPRDANAGTQLTRNIRLQLPFVSAAMDTVTEAEMAIALAQEGGIGIIHKNMSIRAQAELVRRVKRSESGMILDPFTLAETATLADARRLMRDNNIGGIPIIDEQRRLKGILTNRDLRFEKDMSRPVTEVMTATPLVTAKAGTELAAAEDILQDSQSGETARLVDLPRAGWWALSLTKTSVSAAAPPTPAKTSWAAYWWAPPWA